MQEIENELLEMGIQIIAATIDPPEKLRATIDKNSLNYTVVSDAGLDAAKKFGIVFRLDEATLERYKGFGIGLISDLLPVPGTFLVNSEGTIEFQYVNPDYTARVDPGIILAAAKAMKK